MGEIKLNNLDISIIIVNYNTSKLVEKCLLSIKENVKNIEYEIIVVDNNSSDRSIEEIKRKFSNVIFCFETINYGFGTGCNYGFLQSAGRYLLLLNPDTYLTSNVLKGFYDFLENNKTVGVCSALLENENNNLQYCFNDFPGIKWELLELTGYFSDKKISHMLNKAAEMKNNKGYMEIDWAIGACLFIRRSVFELVKGFDENFFLYYEDTDLQKRIKNEGYKIVLLNNIRIKHVGKSSIENSEIGDYMYNINMHISKLKYYKKHTNSITVLIIRIINILAFLLRLIILPFKNQTKESNKIRKNILLKLIKIYLGLDYVEK